MALLQLKRRFEWMEPARPIQWKHFNFFLGSLRCTFWGHSPTSSWETAAIKFNSLHSSETPSESFELGLDSIASCNPTPLKGSLRINWGLSEDYPGILGLFQSFWASPADFRKDFSGFLTEVAVFIRQQRRNLSILGRLLHSGIRIWIRKCLTIIKKEKEARNKDGGGGGRERGRSDASGRSVSIIELKHAPASNTYLSPPADPLKNGSLIHLSTSPLPLLNK